MKNHRFPWLRNRTTDNRKCEKACNIKEKRTIEMFNTVLNLLVAHHSSASVNRDYPRDNRTVIEIAGKPWKHHVSGVFLCLRAMGAL